MKNVLWFSRHPMSAEQQAALGDVTITQVDRTITSAMDLKDEIDAADIIAVVAPVELQKEFFDLADGKPVIIAESERVIVKSDDGSESKVKFVFKGWSQIKKIEIEKVAFKG